VKTLSAIFNNRYVVCIVKWALGLIFIVSALGKIVDPQSFADNVAAYRLLPIHIVNIFAMILPWVELLVGFSLLNSVALRSGALLAAIMNVVFLAAAASAMARGLDVDCGCFTVAKSKVGWALIGRDTAFLAMAILVLLHRRRVAESSPLPPANC
jgi:putative oxidoreductase